MAVGKAIYEILANDSDVAAIVATRIFPQKVEFTERMPAITYFVIDTTPNNTKNGVSTYDYVRCQITGFGTSYSQAQDLAAKIRTALDYVSGTYAGVVVDKIFFESSDDLYDDNFGEKGIHYVAMDFRFNLNV